MVADELVVLRREGVIRFVRARGGKCYFRCSTRFRGRTFWGGDVNDRELSSLELVVSLSSLIIDPRIDSNSSLARLMNIYGELCYLCSSALVLWYLVD